MLLISLCVQQYEALTVNKLLIIPFCAAMLFSIPAFAGADLKPGDHHEHSTSQKHERHDCHHDMKDHKKKKRAGFKKFHALEKEKREVVMKYINKLPEADQDAFKEEIGRVMKKSMERT